jgi:ribosomal protein L37AE/L43A
MQYDCPYCGAGLADRGGVFICTKCNTVHYPYGRDE